MRRMTVVGGFLVLSLAVARIEAQMVDTQTQIYVRDHVLPGSIYGMAGSAVPPVMVLDGPSAVPSLVGLEGPGPEIGATVRTRRPDEPAVQGRHVVVESVAKDGPAFRAGVKPGDIIVFYPWGPDVDGTRAFARRVHETPPGQVLPVVVVRGDTRLMVSLVPEPARARSPEQP
jgi:S1-C subfamily serine protease